MSNSTGRRAVRNLVFRLHTWLGLHACLVLGVIFFTGLLLLYSPELTNYRQPALWISSQNRAEDTVRAGRIYDAALAEYPDRKVDLISSQSRPWFGRLVYLSAGRPLTVHVNPYTGEVLGTQRKSGLTLRDAVRKIHDSLFVPISAAQVAVNALSFVVLALVITGLITYRRFWKGLFRLPARGANPRARSGAQHRLVAVWVAPFLLASALGSSVFFLNAIGFKARPGTPPVAAERAERLPAGFDGAALDTLIANCRTQVPSFVDTVVSLPGSPAKLVRINGFDSDIGKLMGATACFVEPDTGAVAKIVRASDGNAMVKIKAIAVAVHYGSWAGWFSIILWTICGAASVYLVISGARVFATRSIAQRGGDAGELAGRGTLSLVIEGLGIFKWAYLALMLGIVALLIRAIL